MFTLIAVMTLGLLFQGEAVRVIELDSLEPVLLVSPEVLSGPTPEEHLHELAKFGVKSIVSVDAARPQVELANSLGMRYVHLPLGYDGIDAPSQRRLAKAIRDLPGPIYVHCHRGQNRGPAAAACALIALERVKPIEAMQILLLARTSVEYPGLFAAVESAQPIQRAQIDSVSETELPAVAQVGTLDSLMAKIDRSFSRLELIDAADWGTPADHPDLVPAAEAGILTELFEQAAEAKHARPIHKLFSATLENCNQLEDAIQSKRYDEASAYFALIATDCRACHRMYRDQISVLPRQSEAP